MALSCLFVRELVVRCPYCTTGMGGFLQMVGHFDGRFICNRCGHTARPADPDYVCPCGRCKSARSFSNGKVVAHKRTA